jgi:peptidoglycan/xylan/chitin deacetylase (PgdA/CDA1 family)
MIGAVGAAGWAVRGRTSQLFGPSVWRGPQDGQRVALTFDDGPSEGTPELLELLDRFQVTATFFQCGANAERLPAIARQVSLGGHEIGNHTYSHPALYLRSARFVHGEVARAQRALSEIHGAPPVWFRAPYGGRWFGLRAAQAEFGLASAMWTVMGSDWRLPADEIAANLISGVEPGAILCLHDGRETQSAPDISSTLAALQLAVPRIKDRGYRFVTLSEMFSLTRPASP